jgi:hypothetical protein
VAGLLCENPAQERENQCQLLVLLLQLLPSAVDIEPGAIDQDMYGSVSWNRRTLPPVRQSRGACPTAQRRVIGDGEIQSHQLQHRCQQALRLAQPQAEHQAQRQSSFNRQIGVVRLAAAGRPLRRSPRRQGFRREPERQASSAAKACLIFPPVRYLELHLADAMAAGGIMFEGHEDDEPTISIAAKRSVHQCSPGSIRKTPNFRLELPALNTSIRMAILQRGRGTEADVLTQVRLLVFDQAGSTLKTYNELKSCGA